MKRFNVTVNGVSYDVVVEEIGGAAPVAAPVAAPAAASAPRQNRRSRATSASQQTASADPVCAVPPPVSEFVPGLQAAAFPHSSGHPPSF